MLAPVLDAVAGLICPDEHDGLHLHAGVGPGRAMAGLERDGRSLEDGCGCLLGGLEALAGPGHSNDRSSTEDPDKADRPDHAICIGREEQNNER